MNIEVLLGSSGDSSSAVNEHRGGKETVAVAAAGMSTISIRSQLFLSISYHLLT